MERRILRDIVFSEPLGFRPLSLDLHLAEEGHLAEEKHSPAILFVHGGGWRVGSRRTFCPAFEGEVGFDAMVRAGFAVASVDYRLSGEAAFPASRDDVAAALAWLVSNGEQHGIDVSRIVVWGESAGALLGSLVALQPGSGVRGVIDWFGPSDLLAMGGDVESREAGLLGAPPADVPQLAREASPIFHVHAAAPAFYIAHGEEDRAVPVAQSQRLAAALSDAGVRVEFEPVPGADHLFKGAPDPMALLDRAIDFARSVV